MADFPNIAKPTFKTSEEVYKPQVRTEFEGNYVQSRPAVSRDIRRWNLVWDALPEADYQTLVAFFLTNQGNSFNFTEPVTGAPYVCRFSGNSLIGTHADKGYRSVELTIEEV